MNDKYMNILITSDSNYSKYYQVMLVSLFENNIVPIKVILLWGNAMKPKELEELRELVEEYHQVFVDIRIDNDKFQGLPVRNWAVETYFRLAAFEVLPKEINRILYLDGDIIINQSIEEFYHMDFDDNSYIACEDMAISGYKNVEEYQELQLEKDDIYINAGVELINVEKIRREITLNQIFDFMREKGERLLYADQSTVNCLFRDKIKFVEENLYNCQASCHHFSEEAQLLEKARIIHFTSLRPWNILYRTHYSSAISGDVWWRYARKLPYWRKQYTKWKLCNTLRVKPWQICYRVYCLLRQIGKR